MNKFLRCSLFLMLLGLTPICLFAQAANQNFETLSTGNLPGSTFNLAGLKYSVISPASRTYQTENGTPAAFLSVQTPGGNNGTSFFSRVSKMLVLNQNSEGYEGGTFTLSADGESNYSTGAADLRIATIDGSKFKINSMYIDPGRTNEHPYSDWYSVDVKGYKNGVEVAKITISDFTKTGNRNYGTGANLASYTAVDKGSLTTYGGLLVFTGSNWANIEEIRFTSTGPVAMAIDDLDFSPAGATAVLPTLSTVSAATNVTAVKATMGGTVVNNGNATVTERGIIWSLNSGNLVLGQGNKVIMGSGTGSFSDVVSPLTSGSLIVFRSYAINSAGVGYGETRGFTTTAAMSATVDVYHILCNGASTGGASINIIGGKAPYAYSWSGSGGTGSTVFGLRAGSQTCTVTDGEGSTITQTFVVNEAAVIAVTVAQSNATCNGANDGWAEVTPDASKGPYTYSWSGGATTAKITNLAAGTYTCTMISSGGCSITKDVVITQPNRLDLQTYPLSPGVMGNYFNAGIWVTGGGGMNSFRMISGSPPPGLTFSAAGQFLGFPTATGKYDFTVEVKTSKCNEIATADFSLTINKGTQTFNFNGATTKFYGDADFILGDALSSRSLPVTYTAADPSVVFIEGNKAHILKAGSTEIVASQAGNELYAAATSVSRLLTVNRKGLARFAFSANKMYDGTDAATVVLLPTLGRVGTDDVDITYTSAKYADKVIGTNKAITVTGLSLIGADQANYQLMNPSIIGNITVREIVGDFTVSDKVYDGLVTATIETRSVTALAEDAGNLALIGGTATFANASAGTGKVVNATGMTLSGSAAGNYRLISIAPSMGNITAKDITASFTANSKVYDGLPLASISSSVIGSLPIDAGNVTLTGGVVAFADANVGTGKIVTATGMTLGGSAGGNYNLVSVSPTTANITVLDIVGSFSAEDKAYDGLTSATISSGIVTPVAADAGKLTLTGGVATFANANAGVAKTVIATGMVLGGSAAGNYNLVSVSPSIANITAKEISGGFTASDRVYTGLTSASILSRTITPLAADAGNLSLTGGVANFTDANAGADKIVHATGMVLSGSAAGNYNLVSVLPATATITVKDIIGSFTAANKGYDGLTLASITDRVLTPLPVDIGKVTLIGGEANFVNANLGTGKTVTATGMTLSGSAAGNYNLVSVSPTMADITIKDIVGSFTVSDKVYEGSTSATIVTRSVTPAAIDEGNLTLIGGVATFADANAGTAKTVTATGMTLGGSAAGNYRLISIAPSTGNITPRDITGTFTSSDKVYDGLTVASITNRTITPLAADAADLTLAGGVASFADANAGIGKAVTASGMTLVGSAAGNYNLIAVSPTVANITPLNVTGSFTASNKVYDGLNLAVIVNRTITPLAADAGNLTLTGGVANFSDANVGTGKAVAATGMTLGGSAAGNYNLVSVLPVTANISVLDISGSFTSANKVYDGLTSAVITNRTITPLVADAGKLTLTGGVASFADANAGIGKIVNATGMTLSGAAAGNYHLIPVLPATANITPKDITGSFTASNKVYDGLTTAIITDRSLTPLTMDAGKLTLTGGLANFADANVAVGKTVTATGMILSGTAAANYNLVSVLPSVANISAKAVIVTVNANQNKIYGGVNPDLNYTITPGGLLGTDVLSGSLVRLSGENVGFYAINKGSLVAGANYALQFEGNSFEIKPATLTVIADPKEKFIGTANPPLTISYTGFVNNEGVAALSAAPYIGTTATLNSGMGSYPITVGGASAINYSISYQNGILLVKPGAPTSVSLAAIVVFENRPAGTKVGDLSSTSQDPNATFTYSLVSGTGDIDNSKFQIVGKELRTSQSLDYEEKASYSIRVRSTTQYGFSLDQLFTIQIQDVNEQPTLNAIADQRIYFQTGKEERIGLQNVSPGPETHQTVTASILTDRASLFDRLEVVNNQVVYKIKPGQLGEANITVTITDNGGTANGGVDKISRSFNLKVDATPVITGTGTQIGLKTTTDYVTNPSIGKGLSSQLQVQAADVVSYRWTGTGLNNINIINPTAKPLTTITYQVTITNSKGYSVTLPITVEVREDYIVEADNNFSPNGDGINDTWVIKNIENYPNHVVTIFDRAGRVLYSVNGYKNTWDGTVNGSPLAEGTYYYMIKFMDQKIGVVKGFITIVR